MPAPARPQLFEFEKDSSENLAFIPLCVRFHLDRAALRISLADWQTLPWRTRAALSCFPVAGGTAASTAFADALRRAADEVGIVLQPEAGAMVLPDPARLPDAVAHQCELAGVAVPQADAWRALTDFQRYALQKLSRKATPNHDFLPALAEFGLVAR